MQININKKPGILTGVIAVLIGVIIFIAGSQNSSVGLFGMNHSMGDGMGGMFTKSELSTLKSLSGSKFETLEKQLSQFKLLKLSK